MKRKNNYEGTSLDAQEVLLGNGALGRMRTVGNWMSSLESYILRFLNQRMTADSPPTDFGSFWQYSTIQYNTHYLSIRS